MLPVNLGIPYLPFASTPLRTMGVHHAFTFWLRPRTGVPLASGQTQT
ncbi:hypothetical protein QF026_004509 [Streptomyces aurantiacus]|nr:hypothetical protein [Streptomyces aurantiacus]